MPDIVLSPGHTNLTDVALVADVGLALSMWLHPAALNETDVVLCAWPNEPVAAMSAPPPPPPPPPDPIFYGFIADPIPKAPPIARAATAVPEPPFAASSTTSSSTGNEPLLLRAGALVVDSLGRLMRKCLGSPCCGPVNAYTKFCTCTATNPATCIYIHSAVVCDIGGAVGSRVVLHAGKCYTTTGQTFSVATLPQGAVVVESGTVQCVAAGCAAPVCDERLYVQAWPCKKNTETAPIYIEAVPEGFPNPVYVRSLASPTGGTLKLGYCLNGPSLTRAQIPDGTSVINGPHSPQSFAVSCCAVHCTPNKSCVPGCCCSGPSVPMSGTATVSDKSFDTTNNAPDNPAPFTTYNETTIVTVCAGGVCNNTRTAITTVSNPPNTDTRVTTFISSPLRAGPCECGWTVVTCNSATHLVSQNTRTDHPNGSWESFSRQENFTATFPPNDCNECKGPSQLATFSSSGGTQFSPLDPRSIL